MDQDDPPFPPEERPRKEKTGPKPPRRITETYLHNAGLHYLQRFAASTGQFRKVIMRKVDKSCRFHKEQDRDSCVRMVDELVAKFQRAGLLNDSAYAAGLAASLRRRGSSRRAVEAKLRTRGVGADDIAAALNDGEDGGGDQDFNALLRLMKRKRIGPFRKGPAPDSIQKELAAVARAGFSYEDAQRGLNLTPEDAESMLLEIMAL